MSDTAVVRDFVNRRVDSAESRLNERLDQHMHRLAALEARLAAMERWMDAAITVVNAHNRALAQDHGGTEAEGAVDLHPHDAGGVIPRTDEKNRSPDGAASVQPSPAPADHARAAILRWRALAQGRAPAVTAAFQSCADELEAALPAIARAEVERFAAWWERQRDEDLGHNNCTICERVRDPKAMVARYFAEQEAKDG